MGLFNISKYVLAFVAAMGASAIFVPAFIFLARRYSIFSKVDFRRKNKDQTPLLGGVAIFLAFLLASLIVDINHSFLLLLCAIPIFIVGVLDDIWELPSQPKFVAQIISVALWLGLTPENGMLLEQIGMARSAAFFLTAFWMVGIINATNFIDGMDGEAATTIAVALLTIVILTKGSDLALTATALTGATLGFLLYNMPKAKIYLGDNSTFLGFSAAALAAQLPPPGDGRSYVLVPLFIFAFVEVDACLAIFRRLRHGTSLFKGDHEHIHHKLQKLGFSVGRSLIIITSVVIYSCFTAWFITQLKATNLIWSAMALSTLGLSFVLGGVYYVYYRLAKQVSVYSRTLMHKYINFRDQFFFDSNSFAAASFDLLPYYKELQQRGLLAVDDFIRSFSRLIDEICPGAELKLVGSYTVVALLPKQGESLKMRADLAVKFHDLLEIYSLVKTSESIPIGFCFYADDYNKVNFIRLANIEASTRSKERPAA